MFGTYVVPLCAVRRPLWSRAQSAGSNSFRRRKRAAARTSIRLGEPKLGDEQWRLSVTKSVGAPECSGTLLDGPLRSTGHRSGSGIRYAAPPGDQERSGSDPGVQPVVQF